MSICEPMGLSSDIFMINDILELFDLNINIDDLIKFAEQNDLAIKDDDNFWNNFRNMYTINNVVASLYEYVPSLTYDFNFPLISYTEVFELVSDFFKNYDKDIFCHYNKLIDGNFIYRCDSLDESFATTFNLTTQGCDYILFDGTDSNIVLASTIVHEVIHSYINSFLRNISFEERIKFNINALDEVYSHFIEFAFLHYLKDSNYDSLVTKNLNDFLNFSLANYLYYFNDSFNNFNEDNFDDYVISEIYAYGSLMGLHYFYKYLESPVLTKKNILSMTLDSTKYDKMYLLNNYGLSKDEICNHKFLIKHLNSSTY